MSSPDFFGITDSVKRLTPPSGYEAIHRDGFSWARAGHTYEDTTRIGAEAWNQIIGNFRALLTLDGVIFDDVNPFSPYLLRDTIVSFSSHKIAELLPGAVSAIVPDIVADEDFQDTVAAKLPSELELYTAAVVGGLLSQRLAKADNLADVADAAEARDNLGLGTAAVAAAADLVNRANHAGPVIWPVATRTAMKALSPSQIPLINLTESGREGFFKWDGADQRVSKTCTSISGNNIVLANHRHVMGNRIKPRTSVNGLTAGTVYYVLPVLNSGGNGQHTGQFALAASWADVLTQTVITLTGTDTFTWDCFIDPLEGVYVIPDGYAADGSEGAWVRQFDGFLDPRWFGAVGDGTSSGGGTVNTLAIQEAADMCGFYWLVGRVSGVWLRNPQRQGGTPAFTGYLVDSTLFLPRNTIWRQEESADIYSIDTNQEREGIVACGSGLRSSYNYNITRVTRSDGLHFTNIGVRLIGFTRSKDLEITQATGYTVGVKFDNDGFFGGQGSFNGVTLKRIGSWRIGLWISDRQIADIGYSNEMVINGPCNLASSWTTAAGFAWEDDLIAVKIGDEDEADPYGTNNIWINNMVVEGTHESTTKTFVLLDVDTARFITAKHWRREISVVVEPIDVRRSRTSRIIDVEDMLKYNNQSVANPPTIVNTGNQPTDFVIRPPAQPWLGEVAKTIYSSGRLIDKLTQVNGSTLRAVEGLHFLNATADPAVMERAAINTVKGTTGIIMSGAGTAGRPLGIYVDTRVHKRFLLRQYAPNDLIRAAFQAYSSISPGPGTILEDAALTSRHLKFGEPHNTVSASPVWSTAFKAYLITIDLVSHVMFEASADVACVNVLNASSGELEAFAIDALSPRGDVPVWPAYPTMHQRSGTAAPTETTGYGSGDVVWNRTPAVGSPPYWIFDGANWIPAPNL